MVARYDVAKIRLAAMLTITQYAGVRSTLVLRDCSHLVITFVASEIAYIDDNDNT